MYQKIEVPVHGMDCAECVSHVHKAISGLPGVQKVDVLLSSEKAVIQLDAERVTINDIRSAVADAGYRVPEDTDKPDEVSRSIMNLFGIVFGAVLFIVVIGEGLGLFETLTERVPFGVGLILVLIGGYPIFLNVIRAARRGQVIAHTMMCIAVVAALAIGEWATAGIVVFLMRMGEYTEHFTTERSRGALRTLTSLVPQTARVERNGEEIEIPATGVEVDEIVVVRPGERIPVDGEVISGGATINQAAITGESMPIEAGVGTQVYAATIPTLGSLRIRATRVGNDTTFGRVIRLVEEAETHRADVQRIADRFAGWYLPVVAGIAALTFLMSRNPLATAAVLLVACSCSFALATPIAMLASVGAAAKNGLLVKGGKYLELLSQADVLLIDKTGTITAGEPQITDVITLNGLSEPELLSLAASVERYSEHPLAEAVRQRAHGIVLSEPAQFQAVPGHGVEARIDGQTIRIGGRRWITGAESLGIELEAQGKTVLFVEKEAEVVGMLAAADTLRPEVPAALAALRDEYGLKKIELLTGDNERTAAGLAAQLGVDYRANLLPEDKIAAVKAYQAAGHKVVMVGDGVNDAPALAQADIGIAMGAAGSPVAIEAAHLALMRDDWMLVPRAFQIAKHTMNIVRLNIGFTLVYNTIGLTLAAFGFLPPVIAAAAQSLPDLGILANSSRLLRQ